MIDNAGLLERLRRRNAGKPPRVAPDTGGILERWQARCAAENEAFFEQYAREHAADAGEDDETADQSRRKRRPLAFTKRDLARAIAGHLQAGLSVQRVEIDKSGRIAIITGRPEPTSITPANEWDSVR